MGLPGGFVIEAEGKQIYFAGDTYFGGFMKEIAARFRLDLALMPVTTFRIPMTMGEKGAARAVEVLGPRTVIPIHLGIQPALAAAADWANSGGLQPACARGGIEDRGCDSARGRELDEPGLTGFPNKAEG